MSACSSLPIAFLILAEMLLFSATSQAQEISDPHQALSRFPYPQGQVEFSNAFICGQPLSFFARTGRCKVHCEFGICEQTCSWDQTVETQFQAEECSPEQLMIYSSLGHAFSASENDYKAARNSIALTLIKAIPNFYENIEKIQIENVFPGFRKALIENGQMKPVFLTMVSISLFPDHTKQEHFGLELYLDLNRSGLQQVMCVAEHGPCDSKQDYILKRKGLVNAPP